MFSVSSFQTKKFIFNHEQDPNVSSVDLYMGTSKSFLIILACNNKYVQSLNLNEIQL